MVDNREDKVVETEVTVDVEEILLGEETSVEEEPGKKFDFWGYIKKNGFYVGIGLILLITVIVMFSDRDRNYSGDVSYNDPVYYITGNNLYIKERGRDEVLISSTLFQSPDGRTKEEALSAALISEDGEYLYFYENIEVATNGAMTGDFCVYHKSRKHLIQEDVGIYFAVSDDSSKVVYIKPNYGVTGGSGYDDIRYDLYSYTVKDGNKLIERAVEPAWYNISGDGNVVFYTKFYDASTDTSSLFKFEDNKSTFIDDHMYFYGDIVPKGTFRLNWPKTNYDGSKLIYGKRMKYGELAQMHLYSNNTTVQLGEDVLQVFTDENLDSAIMVHNYDREAFVGDMSRIDLNSLAEEAITTDVWGLSTVSVTMTGDAEYIGMNLYWKNYDEVINVGDLCMMTEEGEKVLIKATDVSNIQFGNDYMTIYGLEYYVPEEGGQITKVSLENGIETTQYDEFVQDFTISESGKYLMYMDDTNLFLVGEDNNKIYIDKEGIETFGILSGEEKLYYFREVSMGSGVAYVRGLGKNDRAQMVTEETHYCWDFGDGSLAFLTNYDFGASTGTMYLTDGEGGYELIVENVELPLFFNFIQ